MGVLLGSFGRSRRELIRVDSHRFLIPYRKNFVGDSKFRPGPWEEESEMKTSMYDPTL